MIACAVAIAVPGIVIAAMSIEPEYRSAAQFRFLASEPAVLDEAAERYQPPSYDTFVNTQLSLLTGNAILGRVLQDPEVERLPAIQASPAPMGYLRGRISAATTARNELVEVECLMPTPEGAHVLMSAIVMSFQEYMQDQELAAGGSRAGAISEELEAVETELESQTARLADLKAQVDTFLESEGDFYRTSTFEGQEQLAQQQAELEQLNVDLERLDETQAAIEQAPETTVYEFDLQSKLDSSPPVTAVRQELIQLESDLLDAQARYTDGMPQIRALERAVDSARDRVAAIEGAQRLDILRQLEPALLEQIRQKEIQIERSTQNLGRYQSLLDDYNERVRANNALLATVSEQETRIAETRASIATLQDKLTSIRLESKAPARVQLVAGPTRSDTPDRRRLLKALALVVAFAGASGVGVGVARELLDQQIYSEQDVAALSPVPVIASLPHLKFDARLANASSYRIALGQQTSAFAEEIRRIAVHLQRAGSDAEMFHTIMICSAAMRDGRTTLAANLGAALAQTGRRVLLVDLNIRRPYLELALGLDPAPGISDLMAEQQPIDRYVRRVGTSELYIVGPGLHPENLIYQLSSQNLEQFFAELEGHFDHIVIDTPPMLVTSDAKVLAPIVDAVLLLIGIGTTNLGMAKKCVRELQNGDGYLGGLVLNRVVPLRGGYLRKRLTEFYEYTDQNGHGKTHVRDIEVLDVAPRDRG